RAGGPGTIVALGGTPAPRTGRARDPAPSAFGQETLAAAELCFTTTRGRKRVPMMRTFASLAGLSLALAPCVPHAAAAAGRPNILYIMADDHAAHAISAYGSKINQTPHIDRIAKGGMRFTQCLVTNSICTPSRAAILTGKYAHINGV